VADALTDALIELGQLLSGGPCLEVGVGTGRIALPLAARGVQLVGVDLSFAMLERLASKWPYAPLVQADAAHLPLAARAFDAALMVHVLHVIADWQQALREVRRVVRPGGILLHVWNNRRGDNISNQLTERFRAIVEASGGSVERPGARTREDAVAFWGDQGWAYESIEVLQWQEPMTPADHIQQLRDRIWSGTWQLSERQLTAAVDELARWAELELGSLERSYPVERIIMVDVVHLPK
jgi:SAM-dependent methyltransferase